MRRFLGLSQAQVARFASVALRTYRRIENQSKLPQLFQLLNQVAKAFGMSFECNLLRTKPDADDRLIRRVTTVAAAYRSPYLYIAAMNGDRTLSLRRQRLRSPNEAFAVVEPMLIELDAYLLVIEPRLLKNGRRGRFLGTITKISLADAKAVLFPGEDRVTHRQLFEDLVHHYPELRSSVKVLATGRVAMADPWRAGLLIPAALGIAVHRRDGDPHTS